nr:glutamate receptor ionotropic, delta-1-like [Penaeus vannamei]
MAGFTITHIRDTVIDFTHAFYEEPTTILIPPPREQDNFLAFLQPFTWQVWLIILASVVVVGPVMWFMGNFSDQLPILYPYQKNSNPQPLFYYMWGCAFSLTSQGSNLRHTEPARLLHAMWWCYCLIVVYTYTGSLIAFLTVPRLTSLINSLEELANQREVLWTYRAKTAHDSLFSTAPPGSVYSKIGQLIKEQPDLLVTTDAEGVQAVLKGDMAFIKEKSWLDFQMELDYLRTGECRLAQVNQLFFSAGFGWVLEEGVGLPPSSISSRILRMAQSGLFSVWRQQYWPKPNECTAGGGQASGPKPLKIKNFLGHFFVLGVGLSTAILAYALERVYFSYVGGDEMRVSKIKPSRRELKEVSRKIRVNFFFIERRNRVGGRRKQEYVTESSQMRVCLSLCFGLVNGT